MTTRDPMLDALPVEGAALLELVLEGPDLDVAACPGWSMQDLLGHVAGAHRWASHVLEHGKATQQRVLEEPPGAFDELVAWYESGLAQLETQFDAIAPTDLVWTPTAGVVGSSWWRRKIAVETAIHRWDADDSSHRQTGPEPLSGDVAVGAVDEFVSDFLPGLLALHGNAGPHGAIRLEADDTGDLWPLSLDHLRTATPSPRDIEFATTAAATASDLALWMWNRLPNPLSCLRVVGDTSPVLRWTTLRI